MTRLLLNQGSLGCILVLLFITSCGDNLIEDVKERYSNGNLKVVEYYKKVGDNQELVREIDYYENGQIFFEKYFKNGKREGKWTSYYEKGQIQYEGHWEDGKAEGKYTMYYENGQIEMEGNLKDGKEDAKWTIYWENGQIKGEANYKDGVRID